MDPSFVDSFFDDLMPWVHYIPVRSDLSDLFNVTAYAMSDDNQPEMENIIKAANDWCTRSQTKWNMALDALLRLLEYVSDLNASDYSWHNTWMADPVASSKGVVMTLVTVSSSSIVAEENVRDALLNIQ